jgi:hypothetical protein
MRPYINDGVKRSIFFTSSEVSCTKVLRKSGGAKIPSASLTAGSGVLKVILISVASYFFGRAFEGAKTLNRPKEDCQCTLESIVAFLLPHKSLVSPSLSLSSVPQFFTRFLSFFDSSTLHSLRHGYFQVSVPSLCRRAH